jgi:hypothetical protein
MLIMRTHGKPSDVNNMVKVGDMWSVFSMQWGPLKKIKELITEWHRCQIKMVKGNVRERKT